MMSTAQINTLIFKHLGLHDSFWECMQYMDNEKEIPTDLKDMVIALQIVRTAINIQSQLTEESINNAMKLVEENSYNSATFQRAIKRVKMRHLE